MSVFPKRGWYIHKARHSGFFGQRGEQIITLEIGENKKDIIKVWEACAEEPVLVWLP